VFGVLRKAGKPGNHQQQGDSESDKFLDMRPDTLSTSPSLLPAVVSCASGELGDVDFAPRPFAAARSDHVRRGVRREIVGDKLLYTTSVLAARYRSAPSCSEWRWQFMCKMAVAVAIGAAISRLPPWLVASFTAASFIGVAITVWRKPDVRQPKAKDSTVVLGRGGGIRGDLLFGVGRRRAVHRRGHGREVCLVGANINGRALADGAAGVDWRGRGDGDKGALAGLLGEGVRRWIADRVEPRVIRYVATAALIVLGILAVLETLGILVD
jgi:putative Ca2+/H+ antiporter (TMEM165/GDT1 family)